MFIMLKIVTSWKSVWIAKWKKKYKFMYMNFGMFQIWFSSQTSLRKKKLVESKSMHNLTQIYNIQKIKYPFKLLT